VQVAQYPPLRVGRDPESWAFTLENEYVNPRALTSCTLCNGRKLLTMVQVVFTSRAYDEPQPAQPEE
jgi:hypothetical protein